MSTLTMKSHLSTERNTDTRMKWRILKSEERTHTKREKQRQIEIGE